MRIAPLVDLSRSIPCISGEGGGVCPTPLDAHPLHLDADPPLPDVDTPGCRPPDHVTCDACWEANPPPPSPWTDKHLWKHYLSPNFVGGAVTIRFYPPNGTIFRRIYHCEVTSENLEYFTYDLLFGSIFELVFQVPIISFPKKISTICYFFPTAQNYIHVCLK